MFIYFAVIINSYSFPQTIEFSGTITQNTEWNYDTVKITGNVTVNSMTTLTISEGTLIQFQGNYEFSSVGSLYLLGSPEKKIIFTIYDTTGYSSNRKSIGWGGLKLNYEWDGGSYGKYNPNDSTIIEYCVFEYSKNGAITIENFSKIRISNSIFRRNYGSDGSGINLYYSNALIKSCSFFENYSYNSGGAIYLSSSGPGIYNSTFINNEGSQGGAIDILGEKALILNNIFCYNSTYNGGAIKFHAFNGIIANNIICYNNAINGGGAIYGGSGSLVLVNNTICNNSSDYAPGIYLGDDYYIYNTVFYSNRSTSSNSEQIFNFLSENRPTVQNCVIEDGKKYNTALFTKFDNILYDYPDFKDSNNLLTYNRDTIISNWSFDSTSNCVDKGINSYYRSSEINLKMDIFGNERISNNIVDIGAFEFQFKSSSSSNFVSFLDHDRFIVFPNPTNGEIFIKFDSEQNLLMELFDLNGRLVNTQSLYSKTEIDLSKYKKGIYFLKIKDDDKLIGIRKIVKY